MTFKPGQVANPKGRPPKRRAWADLIAKKGLETVRLFDGTEVIVQDLIASLTMQALMTGKVDFPRLEGQRRKPRTLILGGKEWIKFLKETREHLEPAARQEFDITSDGESITPTVNIYIPDNARDKP